MLTRYTGGVPLKTEKKRIVVVSTIVLVAVIAATIFIPYFRNKSVSGCMKEDLKNVDNVSLIAHCAEIDGKKDSVAGVKESVRLGANAVIVDLCFRKDGTPVMTDDYSSADSAETVEQLFKAMNDDKYNKTVIYLNIVQLGEMTELNTLAVEYGMLDRLFLTGIDSDRYDLIKSDDTIVPFLLDYTFNSDELSSMNDGSFKKPDILEEKGATGFVINASQISPELVEVLHDYGIYFMADGIDGISEMCEILLDGTENVTVSDIAKAKETLDKWTEKMQERYKASVEKSIKELSNKAEEN